MSQFDDALNALDALIDTLPTQGPQAKYGIRFAESARRGKALALTCRSVGWFVAHYRMTLSGIVRGSGELLDPIPERDEAADVAARHCMKLFERCEVDLDGFNAEFREFQERHGIVPSYPPGDG